MDHLAPTSPKRKASVESLRLEPLSRTLTISNDGYDYTDAGVAPEDVPTTGRQAGRPEKVEPPIADTKQFPSSRRLPDGTLRLWTRWIDGAWRPKVPDEESIMVEPRPAIPRNAPTSANMPSAAGQKHVRDFEIMHNWTQNTEHDEAVFYLNVVRRTAGNAQNATPAEKASTGGHIRWIHSKETSMAHSKFEDLFSQYASRHVDSGVRDLTRRLLKRVWVTDEREFVGGRFLNPATTRYDGQSKNDDEKPCTFFNFPYFSVGKPHTMSHFDGGPVGSSLEHPVRTLLQSRYRLEATDVRDADQSITKLSPAEVRTCIRPSPSRDEVKRDDKVKPIVHVPQLWCLSLSGDVMVTSGPISESDLRGSAVMTKETNIQAPQGGRGPSVVRIFLEHSGKQQPFLYPKNQCDWWFGLLNKQRQILKSLGDGDTEVKFGEYKFYTKSEPSTKYLVDIYNWHEILSTEERERLDLWMKRTVPDLTVTEDSDDEEAKAKVTRNVPETHDSEASMPPARLEISSQGSNPTALLTSPLERSPSLTTAGTFTLNNPGRPIPRANGTPNLFDATFQPFFEWPFLDDGGKLDGRSPENKVKLWLHRIHGALQGKYGTMILERDAREGGSVQVSTSEDTVQNRQRKVCPCSYEDVYARLGEPKTKRSRYISTMESLCIEVEQLFRLFIRNESKSASARSSGSQSTTPRPPAGQEAIELYWGAVDTIILCLVQYEGPEVEINELLQGLRQIISGARELHFGVRSVRSAPLVRQDDSGPHRDGEIKLLLEVVVDAFEAVFSILFGAVRYLSTYASASDENISKISSFIGRHVAKSCKLLVVAKARLIVEADEISHDKDLGPVVTPEAIIIMLLERLSRGVYLDATIDVMDLYEKIVEKIALKVEKGASRRLLLEINRVSEELDIINDVLRQQSAVLTPYRESLDPATFKTPSIPRRMKFQYESTAIDKILKAINESILDCAELRERASRLAIQNVQLVETQLEDNSKAIIVFTVVTIFFLPLSFVTGFFGMNLGGISGTTSTVKHFWVIALPLTFGVVFACLFAAFSGSIKRWLHRHAKRRKEKTL